MAESRTLVRLRGLLEENPDQTLQELGDACGVTREWIRRLIDDHGFYRGRPLLAKVRMGPQLTSCQPSSQTRCDRCSGNMVHDGYEPLCIQCGWRPPGRVGTYAPEAWREAGVAANS